MGVKQGEKSLQKEQNKIGEALAMQLSGESSGPGFLILREEYVSLISSYSFTSPDLQKNGDPLF